MSHFLLFLSKTSHHATQRMAGCGDACGVARGDQRPTSTFSQMALGPAETSCSKRESLERCPHCRRVEGRHSPKRATGHRTRRCTESCLTVANSNCSVWQIRWSRGDHVARGDEEGAAGSPGASYLKSDQRMRGVHCSSGEAFGSPRPAQVEIGIRFGGWLKPIAAFARSCRGHSADAEPCASGPSRLGCSNPVSSTDGQISCRRSVRNRFGALDEDTVLRPSRRLVLEPIDKIGDGRTSRTGPI